MSYIYCTTPRQYEQLVKMLRREPDPALDSETYVKPEYRTLRRKSVNALNPHTGRMSLLTIKGRRTCPIIFDLLKLEAQGYDRQPMYDLLTTREKIIGARLQFDLKFIKRHFGVTLENGWDVICMAKLISNATGSKFGKACGHGLADLCRDWLDIHIEGKGEEQVTDWYPRPPADADPKGHEWQQWVKKLEYAAHDTQYLHDLHDQMLPVLVNPLPYSDLIPEGTSDDTEYGLGMQNTLELEVPWMVAIAAEMEYNGLPVSEEIFTDIQTAIWNKQEQCGRLVEVASELCKVFNLSTYPSVWTDYEIPTDEALKTLNNPQKLKKLVSGLVGIEMDNVQANIMERLIDLLAQVESDGAANFMDEGEEETYRLLNDLEQSVAMEANRVCKLIIEYKRLNKQYSIDLREYINPVTGCIHSSVDMLGAATGRTSSSAPNQQNISGRTKVLIERPIENLFPSSANYDALEPDWSPAPSCAPSADTSCKLSHSAQKLPRSSPN